MFPSTDRSLVKHLNQPIYSFAACRLGRILSLGLLFGFTLGSSAAWAGYQPPKAPSAPKSAGTTTGVRRGCLDNSRTSLTAIAPQSHVGVTSQSRPTFVWFMPDAESFEMEFELYEFPTVGPKKNIVRQQLMSQSGWMQFQLLEDAAPLSPEKRYFWQVIVYCNPNRPSSALLTTAELEIQALPPELARQLKSETNALKRAELLAAAGFWYDAIALLTDKANPEAVALRRSLLEDLAQLEIERGEQLRRVAAE